jgi:predicted Zn finger-like uncharacterized protein
MALATTCPHCKTSFKVVADQLKLRRGLVRCGKCQEVFSGVDYLRYIDEPKPKALATSPEPASNLEDLKTAFFLPETIFNASLQIDAMTIQAPVPAYIPSPSAAPSSRPKADTAKELVPKPPDEIPLPAFKPPPVNTGGARKISSDQDLHEAFLDPYPASIAAAAVNFAANPNSDSQPLNPSLSAAGSLELESFADLAASQPRPSLPLSAVEAAALKLSRIPQGLEIEPETQAKMTSPPIDFLALDDTDREIAAHGEVPAIDYTAKAQPRSKLWAALCFLLIFLALVQGIILARNELAIRYADLRPYLVKLSEPFGLKVELPRRFDALTIESFELQATDSTSNEAQVYIAQALLRNQANHAVQWPAIELSLTDPSGQLLARKVLLSSDYLASTDVKEQGFAARSEKNIRFRLSLNQLAPNGYSAVLFYP